MAKLGICKKNVSFKEQLGHSAQLERYFSDKTGIKFVYIDEVYETSPRKPHNGRMLPEWVVQSIRSK